MISPNHDRGFVRTSLGQLHYRTCGEGPPLVMMQTLPFSTAMLSNLMEVLKTRYTCIAIDLLGFSYSDRRPHFMTVEDNAANLGEALDTLGIGRTHLLGGHFSGSVAVELAVRRPTQIASLMLDGMSILSDEEKVSIGKQFPDAPLDPSAQYVAGRWEYVEALMKRLDPEMAFTTRNLEVLVERAYSFMFFRLGGPGGETSGAYALAEKLPQLTVPTLLMASPTDTQRPWHERVFPLIPGGRQHIFDGINPLYQFDRPDRAPEYAAVITDFMRSVPF
jgi:pimeloyl-ACP methyl ester carboxylesterase